MNRLLHILLHIKSAAVAICLGILPASTLVASTPSSDESLAWLTGHWCLIFDGMKTEEFWLPPAGGELIGLSRAVKGEQIVAFEFLRIAIVDGVVAYLAQPDGKPATVFKRTQGGGGWIRFENLQHDFPKRIEYRRSGDMLHAEIAGPGKNGKEKVISFDYQACFAPLTKSK